jgi:hypothetical protein
MNEDITEKRVNDLEDNIHQDLDLLKEYEDKLRYETDPRSLAKCHMEIERQHESLTRNQKEYAELRRQMTSEELQNVTGLLQQKDAKLDEIRKLLPPMSTTGDEIFDVFLSHSHLDVVWVDELAKRLEDGAKLRVWLDKWILAPSQPRQQAMGRRLDLAKSCAVCIGEQTPKGWFQEEIGRVLNHRAKDTTFRVIPVLLPNAQTINVDDFPELRTWIDFKNGLDNSQEFHRLVSGIRGVAPGRGPQEKVALKSSDIPVRDGLIKIREYLSERLIDEYMAREYQRKLLDIDLLKREYSNG